MENDKNNFDDIILEKSNKSEKIKKILLRVIALVILFLVVMIVMKLINTDETADILPNEPLSINSETTDNFENVPIAQNDPEDQFEILRRQIQGNELNNENNITELNENFKINQNNETSEQISEATELKQEKENLTSKVEQQAKNIQENTPKIQNTQKVEKSQKTDTNKQQANTKDLFEKIDVEKAKTSGLVPGIYVQIFSVNNLDQKSKELMAVKEKGYEYKLYKTNVNGKEITKVLVGPFSKDTIAEQLSKIRKDIAKDAFSFTLK